MEAATTYFTRRARQERTSAADAGSAEARSAHLELALRLVKVATEPALWAGWSNDPKAAAAQKNGDAIYDVASALGDAFPLRPVSEFDELLTAMDEKQS